MKITIDGTPEEIAEWVRRTGRDPYQQTYAGPLAPVYPLSSWPWGGTLYTAPATPAYPYVTGATIECVPGGAVSNEERGS